MMTRTDSPQDVVIKYIGGMRDWEAKAARLSKRLIAGEVSKEEESSQRYEGIREVFEEYVCTPVDEKRLRLHSNGRPPVFLHDPALDAIANCRVLGDDAWVTVERDQAGVKFTLVYHLKCNDGCWLICDDRVRVRPDGTSVPYDL